MSLLALLVTLYGRYNLNEKHCFELTPWAYSYLLVYLCFAQAIKVTVLLNILLAVSSCVYGGVYWAMMPAQAVRRPLYFDYGMRGIMRVQKPPTASVDLMAIHTQWSGTDLVYIPQHKAVKDRELVAEQYYAIGIELELPQSSANEVRYCYNAMHISQLMLLCDH
jgi:Putative adipose-regulatory protein (Seipin)